MTYYSSMWQYIMYNKEVAGSKFDHHMGGVSCINFDLLSLITFHWFYNQLSIDLKSIS